ncbi:TIM barrel protein [candidate division KSB1 bacterium]|nr:TIM barrel protein [candidate division KSB1 bacterium]
MALPHPKLSRRNFLKISAGTMAAIAIGNCQTKTEEAQMKSKIQIGLQLYSVRKECEKDFPGTIAAVGKMGYAGVEFAGYYNYPAQEIRKMLAENNLKCCGTHTGLDTLLGENLARTIEFNQILGNKYLIVPGLGEAYRNSKTAWLNTAALFNTLAAQVKPLGMQVGYHNHSFEFTPLEEAIPWELFFGNVTQDVVMQIDTGNMMHGGGDPVAFLKKFPGRSKTIHLKEFSVTNPLAILGEGEVKWQEIFNLCETTGNTEWFIVEEEKEIYPPLDCVAKCLHNLKQLLTTKTDRISG